jgi:hypothetical protein
MTDRRWFAVALLGAFAAGRVVIAAGQPSLIVQVIDTAWFRCQAWP